MDAPLQVTDTNGTRYQLTHSLGLGGQGEVFAVKGGRLAAKLLRCQTSAARETLRNKLARVKRLDLSGVPIARPIITLREPAVGYIMELLAHSHPLGDWLRPPRTAASLLDWYRQTGGLRLRLELAARTADVLSLLHGKGLVFSDLSPGNVFVDGSGSAERVTLIDADNLVYESTAGSRVVYTPGFAAPELLHAESGVNTLTDAHSFAVITYQLLTVRHPLIGDAVDSGEPEREQEALQGLLPWVEDPGDTSNCSSRGLPSAEVVSLRLRELFQRAFGPGLRDPRLRPGMPEWSDRLWTAADATLRCPDCGSTYYHNKTECPWCGAHRPNYVRVFITLWNPEAGSEKKLGDFVLRPTGESGRRQPVTLAQCLITQGESFALTRRHAFGSSSDSEGSAVIGVSVEESRLYLTSLDDRAYDLVSADGKTRTAVETNGVALSLDAKSSWGLHFGPDDELHRVALFRLVASEQT